MHLSYGVCGFLAALGAAQAAAAPLLLRSSPAPAVQAEPVTFGLSGDQRQALYDLTRGAVDFRGYYLVDADAFGGRVPPGARALGPVVPPTWGAPVFGLDADLESAVTPDPALANEWWVKALKIDDAWTVATGAGVTIADCDSGYYTDEPDLTANLVLAERHDFADTKHPSDVADGSFIFHGTAVAAIMAGVRDGKGTNGIAFDARLVPLQNYNYNSTLDQVNKEEATARCVLGALKLPDVKLIVVEDQTATGSSETYPGTRNAIRLAIRSGVTVVTAAGNASLALTEEAADDTGSIIVGALRQSGKIANFSNFGPRVTVAAFGENLHTLYGPGGRIDTFGGTTGAAAQVGGAVALMLSANPSLTPAQVRKVLVETRLATHDTDKVGGLIDIAAAVRGAKAAPLDPTLDRQQHLRARAIEILSAPQY